MRLWKYEDQDERKGQDQKEKRDNGQQKEKRHTMPRKTEAEKLEGLLEKKAQLQAKIAGTKSKVRAQARKRDTRRKIIAGALALEHMGHDKNFQATMKRLLQEHVTRDKDKELFDL